MTIRNLTGTPEEYRAWIEHMAKMEEECDPGGILAISPEIYAQMFPATEKFLGEAMSTDVAKSNCPRCGKDWAEHEFGVPQPYCP